MDRSVESSSFGRRWAWAAGLVWLMAPGAAAAQDTPALTVEQREEARDAFEAGRAAFAAGQYESALDHFERAYAITPAPELLYNIGQSADRLREDERALEAFRGYLDALPEAEDRAAVEARIVALERTLAERRDAGERAAGPEGAPTEEPGPSPDGGSPAGPTGTDSMIAGWTTAGVGAAVAVAGIVLVGVADGRAGEVESAPEGTPWRDVDAAYAQAHDLSIAGGVLLGVGAAAMVAGIVWGVVELGGASDTEIALSPGRIQLTGRF